ncbi:MAG: zinc ribbon domain-containing protein, partial [Desulfovibrio sp.]|nr:zinc ribbon domain-containing protein [Desulfovibrio sp.]
MPIYEYRCQDCEQIFEEWQKDFKEREVSCPVCSARAERLISSTSLILKGTGWYVTDYCKRSDSGG